MSNGPGRARPFAPLVLPLVIVLVLVIDSTDKMARIHHESEHEHGHD